MSLRHWLPSALISLAGLLAASGASAQLVLQTGAKAADWPSGYSHELDDDAKINQRDCIENPSITFNLDYTGSDLSGFGVEAWIGSTCDQLTSRQGNPATCTRVATRDLGNASMSIPVRTLVGPLAGTDTSSTSGTGGTGGGAGAGGTGGFGGNVAASQVPGTGGLSAGGGGAGGLDPSGGTGGTSGTGGSSGIGGTSGTGGSSGIGGTSGTGGTSSGGVGTGGAAADGGTGGSAGAATDPGATVCEGDDTKATPATRTLWFMVLNEDLQLPNAQSGSTYVQKWTYSYDLVGPKPPTGVTAGIGENAVVVKWSEAEDADSDIDEYWFLCEPPPGETGAAGATGVADGGTDDPLDTDDCESGVFQAGDVLTRTQIGEHACGHAPATASSGEASGLTNFVHYTVAVVGRDDYKNYGKLSSIACATPEPVTDFFEAYRDAGGKAGGGFCSLGTGRSHALTGLIVAGALALLVRRVRRRADRKDASR